MLQKSLKNFLEEFKQAIEGAKNAIEEKQLKKFPVLNKALFGGKGYALPAYALPKVPAEIESLQNNEVPHSKKEELDDFADVDSTPTPIILDKPFDEILVSEADIVKAFYNIWVNLSYTLVTNQKKAIAFLSTNVPFYKSAKEYQEQLNSELGEAFKLLFLAKLENGSVFFKLVELFHYVTEAAVLEYESSYIITESLKKAGKASFTAIQFVFETLVKLDESRKLKVALEKNLAANNLGTNEKIKLIRETQVDILRVFFGQKSFSFNESEPIFIVKEEQLIPYNSKLIDAIISQQTHAFTLDGEASSFLAFSTSIFIINYTTKLLNTLKQLETEIIKLTPISVPLPLSVNNQIEISEADLIFAKSPEKQLIEEKNSINLEEPQKNIVISEETVEVPSSPLKVDESPHEEKKTKVEKIEFEAFSLPAETVEKTVELEEPIVPVSEIISVEETKSELLIPEKLIVLHETISETMSPLPKIKEEIIFTDSIPKEPEVIQSENLIPESSLNAGIFSPLPAITSDSTPPDLPLKDLLAIIEEQRHEEERRKKELLLATKKEPHENEEEEAPLDISFYTIPSEKIESVDTTEKTDSNYPVSPEETSGQNLPFDLDWIELSNESSESEQNNEQNNTEISVSPNETNPLDTTLDESGGWRNASDIEEIQPNQNGIHWEESEPKETIIDSPAPETSNQSGYSSPRLPSQPQKMLRGGMPEELSEENPETNQENDESDIDSEISYASDSDKKIEDNNRIFTTTNNQESLKRKIPLLDLTHLPFASSPEFTPMKTEDADDKLRQESIKQVVPIIESNINIGEEDIPLETIINVPVERKTTQPETYRQKTIPPILEIPLYIGIFILLAAIGAGIGFLAGGVAGAMLGGLIGAMVSEVIILYLTDEKPMIDFYIEDEPLIVKDEIDQTDNIRKNALGLNHDKIFTEKENINMEQRQYNIDNSQQL